MFNNSMNFPERQGILYLQVHGTTKSKLTTLFCCRWTCLQTLPPPPRPINYNSCNGYLPFSLLVTCLSVWQLETFPILCSQNGWGVESVLMTANAVDLLYLPMFNGTTPQRKLYCTQSTRVSVPSSELAPPQLLPASECAPPFPEPGGPHLGEGEGGANSDDWRKSLALSILCVLYV